MRHAGCLTWNHIREQPGAKAVWWLGIEPEGQIWWEVGWLPWPLPASSFLIALTLLWWFGDTPALCPTASPLFLNLFHDLFSDFLPSCLHTYGDGLESAYVHKCTHSSFLISPHLLIVFCYTNWENPDHSVNISLFWKRKKNFQIS